MSNPRASTRLSNRRRDQALAMTTTELETVVAGGCSPSSLVEECEYELRFRKMQARKRALIEQSNPTFREDSL